LSGLYRYDDTSDNRPGQQNGRDTFHPRDMWVSILVSHYGKINSAYTLGENYKLPGGGPGLTIQTVENFVGIPIQYYAQVDFDAFASMIDDIGGYA